MNSVNQAIESSRANRVGIESGKILGAFQLREYLGSGGTGTVYRADLIEDKYGLRAGDEVALKIFHPHLMKGGDFLSRVAREAELSVQFEHPNVIRTHGIEQIGEGAAGARLLVMEFVEGQTLRQLKEDLEIVPEPLLREIALQISAGLVALHATGIVHRDIKPENILISGDHQIRIMDLGLAKLLNESVQLTIEGNFAGSLHYAAPEQLCCDPITGAVDLYSMGVLLYELATGENPFARKKTSQVLGAHLTLAPPRIHDANPDCPLFFSEFVACLLEKKPADRLGSAKLAYETMKSGEKSEWWLERKRDLQLQVPRLPVQKATRLCGRSDDLQLLRELWDRGSSGEGALLLLDGEGGIGKTRLMDAFLREFEGNEGNFLYGAYGPFCHLGGVFRSLLDFFGEENLEEDMKPRLPVSPELAASFASLIRHEAAPGSSAPMREYAVHSLLCRLMHQIAEEKPLLWIIEDLQFAGPEDLQLVLTLARAVAGHPIFFVMTKRAGCLEDEAFVLSRLPGYREHSLERLEHSAIESILEQSMPDNELAVKLTPRILELSAGVPLFALEILQVFLRDGSLDSDLDGTTGPVRRFPLPTTIRDLAKARLQSLSDQERSILDIAAVQGHQFEPELLALVLHEKKFAILQILTQVERRTRVIRGEAGGCRFDHIQMRATIYRNMNPDLRSEYHRLLAEAMEERLGGRGVALANAPREALVDIANHNLRGGRPTQMLPYLFPVLDHLEESHQSGAAIQFAEDVIGSRDLLSAGARVIVTLRLARLLNRSAQSKRAFQALQDALEVADRGSDVLQQARVRISLGSHFLSLSRHEAAIEWLHEAGSLLDGQNQVAYRHVLALQLGSAYQHLGKRKEALLQFEQALSLSIESDDLAAEGRARSHLGMVSQAEGRFQHAKVFHEAALAIALKTGAHHEQGKCHGRLGTIASSLGKSTEALDHHTQQLLLARKEGHRVAEALALASLGRIQSTLGDHQTALQTLTSCRDLTREIGDSKLRGLASRELGDMAFREGRLEDSEQLCLEAFTLHVEIPYPRTMSHTMVSIGRVLLERGRPDDAARYFEDARLFSRELGIASAEALATAYLTRLPGSDATEARTTLLESGDRLDLGSRMEAQFVLFQATGEQEHLANAHRLLSHLREHAPEACRETLMTEVTLHREIRRSWMAR